MNTIGIKPTEVDVRRAHDRFHTDSQDAQKGRPARPQRVKG